MCPEKYSEVAQQKGLNPHNIQINFFSDAIQYIPYKVQKVYKSTDCKRLRKAMAFTITLICISQAYYIIRNWENST